MRIDRSGSPTSDTEGRTIRVGDYLRHKRERYGRYVLDILEPFPKKTIILAAMPGPGVTDVLTQEELTEYEIIPREQMGAYDPWNNQNDFWDSYENKRRPVEWEEGY